MGGVNASQALNHHLVPLADELNQNKVTPGLLGFVIFAAIACGLWWLMKNMGKQMKKINFEEYPVVSRSEKARAAGDAAAVKDTSAVAESAAAPETVAAADSSATATAEDSSPRA